MAPFPTTANCTDWLTMHDPLWIVAWHDPVVDKLGHAPRSLYVETYWLPVLGPSATWAMRRLTAWLDARTDGYDLSLAEFGRELGLGNGTGRNASVVRTLARLATFGMVTPLGHSLAVRTMLAPLARRHVASLPDALAAMHDAEMASAVRPLAPREPQQPTSGALCDTASLVTVAATGNEARHGDAGFGAADWSGKTTAVPPAHSPCGRDGAGR
ncbi:MAG: hypothetical protein QOK28_2299 [Actinomycetota bacterium]|jgi:hypothetical protein